MLLTILLLMVFNCGQYERQFNSVGSDAGARFESLLGSVGNVGPAYPVQLAKLPLSNSLT